MALTLNTSHPLYANLLFLLGVEEGGSLVDLVTPSRVFVPHASSEFGTGAYGRHFGARRLNDTTAYGASFTPTFQPANNTGTMVVVTNAIHASSNSTFAYLIGAGTTTNAVNRLPRIGNALSGGKATAANYDGISGSLRTIATTTNYVAATPRMWAISRASGGAGIVYVDGVEAGSGTMGNDSASGYWGYVGGANGSETVSADIVWVAWFDVVLTPTQIADLYDSLGADNAFALVNAASATPVSFSGTVPTLNGAEGTAFSESVASYFSGTETPFAYTVQAGTLPAGLSLNGSTGVISGTPTATGTSSGIVIRATDTTPDTADSNAFSIVISEAGDETAPTLTGVVSFASVTQTTYTASWPAGSDNVAVTGYEYQIGGTGGAWTNAGNVLSVGITGRTASTTETVYVRAYDAAGNRSTPAISGEVTTLAEVAAGINVTEPLKNNTGTVLASQSGVRVAVLQAADLVSVHEQTGLTTNGSGILGTISDPAIIAGQSYHVAIKLADGGVGITGPITAS